MSDNNNEPQDDQIDFGEEDNSGFEDFEGGSSTTLGDMWRNNPLVKIGVIAGGLITVIGAIILFGGGGPQLPPSRVAGGNQVNEPPGTGQISQEMKEAIQEGNVQRVEEAVREGGSALPTPTETMDTRLQLPEEAPPEEDPLERWRRIQEERQRQSSVRKPPEPTGNPYVSEIEALANAMAGQMEGILDAKVPLPPVHIPVTLQEWLDSKRKLEEEERLARLQAAAEATGAANSEQIVNIILPAGTVEYAQLITEANSDSPGPILAQIVSGPLAGTRLLGTFQTEEEYLVLNFNVAVINGLSYGINAVAMDPETTRLGMVTEIDHRYFERIILPAAASFLEGMATGIASTNETTVGAGTGTVVSSQEELDTREEIFKGVEEAASKVSEIMTEDADSVEPMIRVQAGTPMGILFVAPVTDQAQGQ